jgi:hypothetical protein
MIGNRRPMSAWRKRSLMAEKLIAREQSGRIPLTARQVTAVIRMFVSTMIWHLLTEQCGLSTDEAGAAGALGHPYAARCRHRHRSAPAARSASSSDHFKARSVLRGSARWPNLRRLLGSEIEGVGGRVGGR